MVFLGLHLGLHDCNISAYKDGKTYYNKYERHSGIKHGAGNFKWIDDTLKKWDIDWNEIEEICTQTTDSLSLTADMFSEMDNICLLYTSPSPRDVEESRMPSSA